MCNQHKEIILAILVCGNSVQQVVRIALDIFSQRDFTGGDCRTRRKESSRTQL